jgi:hypothetical protein
MLQESFEEGNSFAPFERHTDRPVSLFANALKVLPPGAGVKNGGN